MGFLTEYLNNELTFAGQRFEVNPAFDTVLAIRNLFDEEELTDADKIGQALKMLTVSGNYEVLSVLEQNKLLEMIYDQCVKIRKRPKTRDALPTVDFEYDGEYIYASFMSDYAIDLIDAQGILPWKKFIALFQGLSGTAKIREVMRIRSMDVPEFNGKNSKEIQEIQELKSFYALPVRGGGGQKGLDMLFSTLEQMANG